MPCSGEHNCCRMSRTESKDCPYLVRNTAGRNFACGLFIELGDWDKVLEDERYKRDVAGSWAPGINCRDWPEAPEEYRGCNICGEGMD